MHLLKKLKRMAVTPVVLPLTQSEVLGSGIDVTTLPEGHLSCVKCQRHLFECWVFLDNHRLEMGCMECNASYRLLFPMDVSLSPFGKQGRFTCRTHPNKGMVLIHNIETICVGCEKCFSEVRIVVKSKSNLILAEQ
jgi:hypothetical protein